ncbi:hypothetical protein jhhlp_006297 [Lomentospora prolificans]|uniref:DNA endonuclease activator Ctp1 C-terminal domain-containing protein n=1 Tax=Lomentospora prolificans TaxID=41688 RepID=A0A2N3N5I2_9PEZI|nr:hypothetical protein jhhlp_006297 [Lomentospora prolificans]
MTSFTQGRRAIFEALAEVCDKIEDDLKAELAQERQELELLKSRVTETDRLERENRELRMRLQQLPRDSLVSGTPQNVKLSTSNQESERSMSLQSHHRLVLPHTPQPGGSDDVHSAQESDRNVDWKLEAAKNAAKYSRLHSELKTAIEMLVKRKEERDRWKQFAERLQKKIQSLESRLGEADRQKPNASAGANRPAQGPVSTPLSTPLLSRSSSEPALSPAADRNAQNDVPKTSLRRATSGNDCSTVCDTTDEAGDHPNSTLPELPRESGPEIGLRIKQEPSSDAPMVVSERVVKKRKRDEPEAAEPRILQVKQEETSQFDPMVTAEVCDFSPATSVDLDEPSARFDTPRKATRRDNHLARQTPCPAPQARPEDCFGSHQAVDKTNQFSRALQPLSPNVQASRVQGQSKEGLAHAVGALAEDGVSYELSPRGRVLQQRTEPNSSRLTSLLSGTSKPAESPIIKPSFRKPETPRSHLEPRLAVDSRPSATSVWLQTPQPRELPFDKINADGPRSVPKQTSRRTTTSVTPNAYGKPNSTINPSAEPRMRSRPISALKLDDFKINPRSNGGYDYAYSEVVRSKEERACIPGCIDMDCCGKAFRSMALAERGNGRRTAEQLEEDKRLLEDYLGDESYRLFSMTKEERDELWLVAKTKELANRIGKHRHRFSRMKSPPGFWRTDFPDTQELEEDRAQAIRREQEMIQERHREAMRPGGRWVFRDE